MREIANKETKLGELKQWVKALKNDLDQYRAEQIAS